MANLRDIREAWTKELPVDKEWYQKRIEICKLCPHNSANTNEKPKGISDVALNLLWGVAKKDYCTACGCPLAQKASLEHSVCGLAEAGGIPKWGPLEVPTAVKDNTIKIIAKDDQDYVMELRTKTTPVIWLPETKDEVVEFSFIAENKEGYTFQTVKPTCGCTVPQTKEIEPNKNEITIKIATTGFPVGKYSTKTIFLKYLDEKTQPKQMEIKCKLRKI